MEKHSVPLFWKMEKLNKRNLFYSGSVFLVMVAFILYFIYSFY